MEVVIGTPEKRTVIDTETVTDTELAELGIKREDLPTPVRDLATEIDEIKAEIATIKPGLE